MLFRRKGEQFVAAHWYFAFARQALRRMSVQAEYTGAANLGDLEGFADEMSEEVNRLREVRRTT